MNDPHMETWEAENAGLNSGAAYGAWLRQFQMLAGLSDDELDGDRSEGNPDPDLCCLDELGDWFDEGRSPVSAMFTIQERRRAAAEAAGVPALARLIEVGRGHSGQCPRVRRFLVGLYNGSDFPFDLTDLRAVDRAIQQDCLRVLAMDMDGPSVEVHCRIPGTSEIIAQWAADAWPLGE